VLCARAALAQCPDGTPPPCAGDRAAAVPNPRRSVIVFPFENRTGDPSRGYLGEASMNLLGLAIAQWQDMRVYDDERTASLMRRRRIGRGTELDFEDARSMAREARVGTLIMGDIRREADSLTVQAKVHDVRTGQRLETIVRRARWEADPRAVFDSLAAELLGISGAPAGERPSLVAQTTTSLAAYRAYLAGTAALQRFQIDSARSLLGRAIALDSNFAIAYLRLRDADGWAGIESSPERRRAYVEAAERHSASLPPRLRTLVAYHRDYVNGDYARARRTAESMIQRDSTDVEAWYIFGEAHYHPQSTNFPHPDTVGNLGHSLNAFRRALALDSSYVVAFQHLVDALAICGSSTFLVCLPDSAVYAQPESLVVRYGAATLAGLRAQQGEAMISAARAWASAVPGSPRPRLVLVHRLVAAGRYEQALLECEAMDRMGWRGAAVLKATALFMTGRVSEAVVALNDGLRATRDTLTLMNQVQQDWTVPMVMLAGAGGRLAAGLRLHQVLARTFQDSLTGNAGLRMSRADGIMLGGWTVGNEAGQGVTRHADFDALMVRMAHGNAALLRRATQTYGVTLLAAFLSSRDTLLLATLLSRADTAASSSWRVTDAQLALARGDTARAQLRVARHYETPATTEFQGEQGLVRAFAWGDLLARLGRPRDAIMAYARIDSAATRQVHPGLLVRSWAERAALYQTLGDTASARIYYTRFVDAWQGADPALQPRVRHARSALAALTAQAPLR